MTEDPRVAVLRGLITNASYDWTEGVLAKLDAVDPLRQTPGEDAPRLNVAGVALTAARSAWNTGKNVDRWLADSDLLIIIAPALAAAYPALIGRIAELERAAAPTHTDLMVPPESIDAFMEANPLPEESRTVPFTAEMATLVRTIANSVWFLLRDKASSDVIHEAIEAAFPEKPNAN